MIRLMVIWSVVQLIMVSLLDGSIVKLAFIFHVQSLRCCRNNQMPQGSRKKSYFSGRAIKRVGGSKGQTTKKKKKIWSSKKISEKNVTTKLEGGLGLGPYWSDH